MGAALLPLVLVLSVGAPLTFSTPLKAELDRGIQLFEDFKDSEAAVHLRRVLERDPPGGIAAKAHIYLGLIAFNAFDPDEAKIEFRRALEASPGIELPQQASPKARLAFGEVRRDMSKELVPPPAPAAARAPSSPGTAELINPDFSAVAAAPAPATTTTTAEPTPPASSHVASYALIATSAVLTGLAIYGGVELVNYNSMVAAGNSAPVGSTPPYNASQLSSARGPASFWAIGWPVAAVLAAAGVVGAVLAW